MRKFLIAAAAALVATIVCTYAMSVQFPCAGEDDSNCFYDASYGGNHKGWSFVDIAGHAIYLWEIK